MKPGDIVMIFGSPIKLEHPNGQARLIQKLTDNGKLEQWQVEYLDDEGHFYNALIKKPNGENYQTLRTNNLDK